MGSFIIHGELSGKPYRFTLFLLSYWVPSGLLVSSSHVCGPQPEQPDREDRPPSLSSKWPCGRWDTAWAVLSLFWCFSSFVDSHWKYAKINVSIVLLFMSHFQSSQHKTNLKNSRPFWPLGVVPLQTTHTLILIQLFWFSQIRSFHRTPLCKMLPYPAFLPP